MPEFPDAALFPLPLVPFEDYVLADDRPEYPASFFLRLKFTGVFERSAFCSATKAALRRHPLLRAVVRETKRKRFEWVPADRPRPPVYWEEGTGPPGSAGSPQIDLRSEIGLRIRIGEQDHQTEVLLQFHHACCDGLGAVRFVEDLLAAYHAAVAADAEQAPSRPLNPGRLRLRGKFGMNPLRYLLRVPWELLGLLGAVEYFAHRPLPLAAPGSGPSRGGSTAEFPATCDHAFTDSDTGQLRRAAGKLRCTVNDLLLRDLFFALGEWVLQYDCENARRVLRIMIPTNLRTAADDVMPAANVVSMVFLDRRPHRFRSPRALARSVRLEMKICRRCRLGLTMIHFIGLLRKFRGGLERMLPADRCLATAVLSNFGDPTRRMLLPRRNGRIVAGNVTLEKFEALPPLRPMTYAAFGAVSYAGRLTVSLNYDPRRFTAAEGRRLLGGFVRRISGSLSEAGLRGK